MHSTMQSTMRASLTGPAVVALIWFGLLLGVSFLATPVKFLAPSLSLPVALDVGRHTFAALNPLELGLGAALLVSAGLCWRRGAAGAALLFALGAAALLLTLAQTFWLLPVLDARVEIILQGGQPPASQLHRLYIVIDVLKLLVIGTVGWFALRRSRRA